MISPERSFCWASWSFLTASALVVLRVSLQEAAKLNALDLAQYAKIIVSTKALEAIIARVNGGGGIGQRVMDENAVIVRPADELVDFEL